MANPSADLVIIGGGIIGCTIAYYATQAGLKTIVVEKNPRPTQEASWAAAGILAAHASTDQPYAQLSRKSLSLFPQLAVDLHQATGIDIELRSNGSLFLCFNQEEFQNWSGLAKRRQNRGLSAEILSPPEIEKLEPMASREIIGAVLFPDDCQVHSPRFGSAMALAAQLQGTRFICGNGVDRFLFQDQQVIGVTVNQEQIFGDQFVVATGCWTEQLTTHLEYPLPISPVRGQVVMTEVVPQPLTRILEGGGAYIVPRAEGKILIGATIEEAGYNKQTTLGNTLDLIQIAVQTVPCLSGAPLLKTWAGLRPYTKGNPYLGRLPGHDNVVVATGHYKTGILLAPITGQLISQLLTDQTPTIPLEPFRVDRHASSTID